MLLWGEMLLGVWGVLWMYQALPGAGGLAGGLPMSLCPVLWGGKAGTGQGSEWPPSSGFSAPGKDGPVMNPQ